MYLKQILALSHMLAIPLQRRQVWNKAFSSVIGLEVLCYDVMAVDNHISPYFCENFSSLLKVHFFEIMIFCSPLLIQMSSIKIMRKYESR